MKAEVKDGNLIITIPIQAPAERPDAGYLLRHEWL